MNQIARNNLNSNGRNPSHRLYSIGFRLVRAELTEPIQFQEWRNTLGTEFVRIPAGSFRMESPEREVPKRCEPDEGPMRTVRISRPFYLGKHEVTQGEWEAVMGSNPSRFQGCGARCPVENVSWEDVQEFIGKLNGTESGNGYRYRLPAEAEWEYAARAGTADYEELKGLAWRGEFRAGKKPRPVGLKQRNAWGLHDMLGNVKEWTADSYGGDATVAGGVIRGVDLVRVWPYQCHGLQFRFGHHPDDDSDPVGFRLVRTE